MDELDALHKPPFNCECGRGNRVTDGQGSEVCTRTLVLFREANGNIPAMWLPLHPVTEEMPRP